MKWFFIVPVAVLFFGILFLVVLGLFQPIKHSVKRSMYLRQKPETVFSLLDNAAELPKWSSAIAKVEPLPDENGKKVARFTLKWGNRQMIMKQLECHAPTRLVSQMSQESGPVLGTWTYEITPEKEGCRISLTEDGELKNPTFRAVTKLRGSDATINQTLNDLAKRFGESAEIAPGR